MYAGYFLQTLGLQYTTASKSGFLTGLYIVLVPLLGAAVYQKVPGISEWIGVSLATVGMGLMTLTSARFEIGAGDALTLGCAFAFSIHMLVLAHYSRRMQTELLALLQIATCAVISLTTFRFVEAAFRPLDSRSADCTGRYFGAGDGGRIPTSNVGAAVHDGNPRGADFLAGTGFRLADVVCGRARGTYRTNRWRAPDVFWPAYC